MTARVEAAKASVGRLRNGWKYYLVILSVLGAAYDVSNIKSVPLVDLIQLSGDIGKQIRDMPNGQHVELKVTE